MIVELVDLKRKLAVARDNIRIARVDSEDAMKKDLILTSQFVLNGRWYRIPAKRDGEFVPIDNLQKLSDGSANPGYRKILDISSIENEIKKIEASTLPESRRMP